MTDDERDAFLSEERTLRMAVVGADGVPRVTPVWFLWEHGAFWVYNLDRARRTRRLESGTQVGLVVDAGTDYAELRGVSATIDGYEFLEDDDTPEDVRRGFGAKYFDSDHPVGGLDDHTWLRLDVATMGTWDFRKIDGLGSS